MKNRMNVKYISLIMIGMFIASIFLFSGCTETLKGDELDNQPPIIEFVNIPPDGQRFSRNPEIYWHGTDRDGLIDYYRYYVAPVDSVDGNDSLAWVTWAQAQHDSVWTQVNIDLNNADPKTTNVISLKADLLDPVNRYVPQFIFLQAYDMEGGFSGTIFKMLFRNDNPPETSINIYPEDVFVNSVLEGGIITGIRMGWVGSDRKDYEDLGLTAPPFAYEWRLYGPFNNVDSLRILDSLVEVIFVTEDARIFHLNDTLITCDTFVTDTGIIDSCNYLAFDADFFDSAKNTPFLTRDTILRTDWAPELFDDTKLVTNSWSGTDVWTYDMADTIYNAYRNFPLDTTAQLNFLFWIRSRDDADVMDLTPEFTMFPVIEPRYERDIAVLDFTKQSPDVARYRDLDTAKAFWHNTIYEWAENNSNKTGGTIIFDTAVFAPGSDPKAGKKTGVDYIAVNHYVTTGIPLRLLLKHKTLILYNEYYDNAGFVSAGRIQYPEVLSAMDASINVWATWRGFSGESNNNVPQFIQLPRQYTAYFGVLGTAFTRWFWQAFIDPMIRVDDFVGTYSLDEESWPSLDIDANLLESRLDWMGFYVDTIPALPEASWTMRAFGTEVMYLYKSLYGNKHPYGGLYNFEGSPCGHRYTTNLFKSVHFGFTLLTMDSAQAQTISNNVLEWLYDPDQASMAEKGVDRYTDAPVQISLEDARKRYDARLNDK